jgi:2-oxoglutarate ferredoxin oxidoreductase subunit alpha
MQEFSILIGGKAGFGIDKSGTVIARILNRLGRNIYIYRDYPSLIRGGHTFSIIRSADHRVYTHKNQVDLILALNQETLDIHKHRFNNNAIFIYDSDSVKPEGLPAGVSSMGIPLSEIIKSENAAEIMRNTCIIGSLVRALGLEWVLLEEVVKKEFTKEFDLNLKIARIGFDKARELLKLEHFSRESMPMLSGNQAIALGLIKGGLKSYIAYPMTPSSPILHFLAEVDQEFGLKVIHPESEISVILMALGFSYMGQKTAVGTSGGGFCLMTEGLSLSGMGELPLVIIMGQRPGPSTGLPTYSSQADLHFILNAGQGEFIRLVVAPGDVEQSFYWSANALNLSWKYQIPAIVLSDKDLGEGVFNFDADIINDVAQVSPELWDKNGPYKRYLITESGVSPLDFPPDNGAVIKVNSYEHDEYGITTEDPSQTVRMQDKRLRKERYLINDLGKYKIVAIFGEQKSSCALICWGSNKGVCVEVGEKLGLKVIQPIVLSPFPKDQLEAALTGVEKLICVENNATGQLCKLLKLHGINIDGKVLRYDGRPFSFDELEAGLNKVLK